MVVRCECGCGKKLDTMRVDGKRQAVFSIINGRRLRVECASAVPKKERK